MAFLIDSLQYYLMADVLDTKMTGFTAKLEKSTSFEEVKLCHDQFLTEVQASIFLHNPQVMNSLKRTCRPTQSTRCRSASLT